MPNVATGIHAGLEIISVSIAAFEEARKQAKKRASDRFAAFLTWNRSAAWRRGPKFQERIKHILIRV